MKNNVKLILLAATLVVLVFVTGTCQTLASIVNEPAVSFDSVSIAGINFNGVDMLAKITIKNDNPVSVPFPEIKWNLFIRDGSFLSGVIPEGTKIAARGSTTVNLPFTVSYEGLFKAVTSLINADEAPYRIDLAARFPLPILQDKTFTASHSGTVPLLRMPAISFSGVKFTSLSLTKVEFVITWLIDNKSGFAINLDKLDYNFSVNNNPWTSGSTQRISLPARRVTQVPVTVSINSLALLRDIAALAAGGKTANYNCGGEVVLSLQAFENFAPLVFPFTYNGSTNLKP